MQSPTKNNGYNNDINNPIKRKIEPKTGCKWHNELQVGHLYDQLSLTPHC